MPSRQKRRVSLSEEIAELQARFTRIESFPNRSLNAIFSEVSMTNGLSLGPPAAGVWTSIVTAPFDAAFTLARPAPILGILVCGLFYGYGGSGTKLGLMRLAFTSTFASSTPADDVSGNPLISGFCAHTQNDANGIGSGTCVIAATLPAGTYHAQAQYIYEAGAGTVFTVAGSIGSEPSATLSVFSLDG